VVLKVKGNVKTIFKLSRPVSITGFIGENLKLKTVVTNLLVEPIHIEDLYWDESADEALKEKLGAQLEVIEEGKKYAIVFDDKEPFEPGTYSGAFIVKTDFDKVEEKRINVRVVINAEVRAYPERLILPEMLVPEGTTRSFNKLVRIVAMRGDSLKILKVVPSREDIVTNVKEVRPGRMYRCKLTIRPESKTGEYHGYLTFFTNYENYEEIKVEILGSVRIIPAGKD